MHKVALGACVGLFLLCGEAFATCSSYPYTLTNGTTADATQVMADFNCAVLSSGATIDTPIITGLLNATNDLVVGGTSGNPAGRIAVGTAINAGVLFNGEFDHSGNTYGLNIVNNNTGPAAAVLNQLNNGAHSFILGLFGTGFTSSGNFRQDGAFISAEGAGGLTLMTQVAQPIYVVANNSGGVELASGATSWSAISDERVKDWSIPQHDYRGAIQNLWIGEYYRFKDFSKTGTPIPDFGIRAQQAFSVLPSHLRDRVIHRGVKPAEPWTVSAEPFAFLALWGVKDLYSRLDQQIRDTNAVGSDVGTLKTEVAELRKVNQAEATEITSLKTAVHELQQIARVRTARN